MRIAICFAGLALLTPLAIREAVTGPVGQEHWRLSSEPKLEIGSRSGEVAYTWGSVVGVTRLVSGQIVVVDQVNRELSWYDSTGKHERTVGGQGEGPGEFLGTMPPLKCSADSVFIWDPGLGRITVFDSHGTYGRILRDSSLNREPTQTSGWRFDRIACNSGKVFAMTFASPNMGPLREGPTQVDVRLLVVREGEEGIVLGPFPGDDRYILRGNLFPQPLGKKTQIAIGSSRVFVGTAEAFQVRVFSLDGQEVGIIRDDVTPIAVTDDVIDAFLATYPEDRRAMWSSIQYPDYLPSYSSLLVDPDGCLWVEEYRLPGQNRSKWRVYDIDGNLESTLVLPQGFQLYEVGTDYALGVRKDELDVEYVQLYALERDP